MRTISCFFLLPLITTALALQAASPPVVSNVRAAQRPGTKLVDIYYDVADPDTAQLSVAIAVSTNGGATYFSPGGSVTGDVGDNVGRGTGRKAVWNAGAGLPAKLFSNLRVRVTACDEPQAPAGMVLIPAGNFTMGDTFSEGDLDERPTHTVYVSAFYMDKYEVTKAKWDEVYNWAIANGYTFDNLGHGKAATHPVCAVNWYDVVKWCNARSQKEGKTPAYYTDAAMTVVYKTGQVAPYVRWDRGYRLPTEAEWEKAARGGLSGKRFPWGDTISHSQANYKAFPLSVGGYAYDVNATQGYHPSYNDGTVPYTCPVGSFAANGYGLCDMAGNVWEWCWDWYGNYGSGTQTDPRGPASGSYRVFRGGDWFIVARGSRSAFRYYIIPMFWYDYVGFRPVLPPGQ